MVCFKLVPDFLVFEIRGRDTIVHSTLSISFYILLHIIVNFVMCYIHR